MKIKTIKSVLAKKFENWLKTIGDERVRDLVSKGSIITGGSIASMLLGEKVNDYDIYLTNRDAVIAVAKYYVGEFMKNPPKRYKNLRVYVADGHGEEIEDAPRGDDEKSVAVKVFIESSGVLRRPPGKDKGDNQPVFITSNAITLSGGIQVVTRFYGQPEEIHENYDFVHCKNYWSSWDNELVLRTDSLASLLTKELTYTGSKYPLCSIIRTRKFVNRGWTVNAGQFVKMAMQLNDMELGDIETLEDQLVGVDSLYFTRLIEELRKRNTEKIEMNHVIEIIDRIF